MNFNRFTFLRHLEKHYELNPSTCDYCGKDINFKKFYSQIENDNKFCSKKCKSIYENNIGNVKLQKFSSSTEKIIYLYLLYKYPNYIIRHNIVDDFPPYEIDMSILTDEFVIYVEYNSSLHLPKTGKLCKSTQKHQINDEIKKSEICKTRQQKLVRLWSKTGLYNKPDKFNYALTILNREIDYLINAKNKYGQCIDIVIEKTGEIITSNTKYKNVLNSCANEAISA